MNELKRHSPSKYLKFLNYELLRLRSLIKKKKRCTNEHIFNIKN